MTLRSKLLIALSALALLIAAMSGMAIYKFTEVHERVNGLSDDYHALQIMQQSDKQVYRATVAERSVLFLKPGSDDYQTAMSAHNSALNEITALETQFNNTVESGRLKDDFAQYMTLVAEWRPLSQQVMDERSSDTRAGRRTAIDISFGAATNAFNALNEQIERTFSATNTASDAQTEATYAALVSSKLALTTGLIVSLIVCAAITWYLPRIVIKPIREMSEMFSSLASSGGDLTTQVKIRNNDEVGELGKTINTFIASLRDLVADIIGSTTAMKDKVALFEKSANSNQSVAENSQKETHAMATAITQMSASISEVAHSASATSENAKQARTESESGESVVNETQSVITQLAGEVGQAASSIEELKEKTEKINDVVNVIQGIAEQTNLLALNAAIEAARAGEQGRGFAVVADEVRALASRTQSSTEEIQLMVDALQQSAQSAHTTMSHGRDVAESSVDMANRAKEAFSQIRLSIDTVSEMSTQIATAAEEQSSVSNEISANANRISEFGHEAQGISEELSALSQASFESTESLQNKLSIFKV